jgi:2-keto-4-pentenoate hydratase/2-oxohepta-3-ene-1,7-dioic acid hydratase in catechol pathway
MKPDSAILLKQHFVIPEFSEDIHHEIEIIIKINKVGKYIEPKFAHKYYEEISVVSLLDLQTKLKAKGLWEKAKAFDGSAVIGDFTKEQFSSLENLTFELTNNGETVQVSDSSYVEN